MEEGQERDHPRHSGSNNSRGRRRGDGRDSNVRQGQRSNGQRADYQGNSNDSKKSIKSEPRVKEDDITVIGTCYALEKKYFRLKGAPVASLIRPEEILKEWFFLLQRKWKEEKNYEYVCDQLRAVRQDLSVQHIRNVFAVEVYEVHARIALENNDMNEFAVCLSQLESLYNEGIQGQKDEFTAYKLIYGALHNNMHIVNEALIRITQEGLLRNPDTTEDSSGPRSQSLRELMVALYLDDYRTFFQFYNSATEHIQCLLRIKLEAMRSLGLRVIAKAYRPNVPISFVTRELGFLNDQECMYLLMKSNASLSEDREFMNCQETLRVLINA